MDIINISSVQQYTLDRLRISLSNIIDFSTLKRLSYHIYDNENNEISVLQTILESNPSYTGQTKTIQTFDLAMKKNSTLNEGTYRIELYLDENKVYDNSFKTNYLEDIRVSFKTIEVTALDKIHIVMEPLTPDTLYQTKKMMSKMSFSIIESNNLHFSDHFQPLSKIIENSEDEFITEFEISLKERKTLPNSIYTIRLTTPYKSRTFSIVESVQTRLPYLTTNPPGIGNTMITTRANGSGTFLSVIFNGGYMERTMLNAASFKVYTKAGKDITKYFDPTTLSVTYYTSSNVDYITRLDIKMYTEYYQLEQGSYRVAFEWAASYYKNISYDFKVGWIVPGIDKIYLHDNDLKHVVLDLTDAETEEWLSNEQYLVELNGTLLENTSVIFGKLEFTRKITGEKPDIEIHDLVSIPILKKDNITEGNYTFILYHIDEKSERVYDYIGNIDIISEVTPKISSIYQFGIQTLKIELEKRIPISILNQCTLHVVDQFGAHTDYSNSFSSIEDSNIWEPGQTTSNMFDVFVNETATISSGSFQAYLEFRGRTLETHVLSLDYMEKPKGIIDSIIQTGIDTVEINFSETQSRRFLMSVDLIVKDVVSGRSYTERFENWKNVLVDSNPSITTLVLPMDKGDNIPKGKYEFSFVSYTNSQKTEFQTIYKYQVDLGHMTRNIPEIGTILVTKAENGLTEFQVTFREYLEKELLQQAIVTIVGNNGCDLSEDLKEKKDWVTITVSKDNLSFYRTVNIQVRDKDVRVERDTYTVTFSWDGIIPYMHDVSKTATSEYVLPKLTKARVTSVDAEENKGRIYLEFPEVLQESFFINAKVEVLTAEGEDHTDLFDTIQNSNIFSGPTNSINLNITELRDINFGVYQIIIYHMIDYGDDILIRESDYIGILNINATVYPIITGAEQVAINKIEVKLQNPIPKNILEEYYFVFQDCKEKNRHDDFESINDSNQQYWEEDLEEVDSFILRIKPGYSVLDGLCMFEMWSGNPDDLNNNPMRLDYYYFETNHLEGVNGEIESVTPVTLSEIEIHLSSLESRLLFATMSINVISMDGEDFSDRFESLSSAMRRIDTDYFEDFSLKVNSKLPAGTYTIGFYREFPEKEIEIPLSYTVTLPFLTNTYPLIEEVTAGKVGNRMDGEDAIIIMFKAPGMERKQFEASNFIFRTVGQTLNAADDKFPDIHGLALDYAEDDEGTQFIEYITIPLKDNATIQKGDYEVVFNWSDVGTHKYMKEIAREVSLNYILLPVKSIEQTDLDTLKITFLEDIKGNLLKTGKLDVTTIYEYVTSDGTKIIDVSFTSQFQKLNKTNNFVEDTDYNTAILKVGPNEDYPDQSQDILPGRSYRFIISVEQKSTWGGGDLELQYAFSGTLLVDFLMNTEVLNCDVTVDQTSYNILQYNFTRDQLVSFLNNCSFFMRAVDNRRDYSSMFMNVLEANTFTRLGNDGVYITDSYINKKEKDNIIDQVHFPIISTPDALSKLNQGVLIPRNNYEIGFIYKGKEYFKTTKELPLMSGTHPELLSMTIRDKNTLVITFKEYPDLDSVLGSQFDISTYRGLREDGTVIGKSCRSSFGNIIGSEITKIEVEDGITLVTEIAIPISPNTTLASGNYLLKWSWPINSFYHDSILIYGLNAIAGGIKQVRTLEYDTIEVVFEDTVSPAYMYNLDLSVVNEDGEDCSILFKPFKEGNIEMGIEESAITDTYYIRVDEDEVVPPNVYTFTLTETYKEEGDDDIDDENIKTIAFIFSMSITYLAYQFPDVRRVDNLSTEKYVITKITNDNAKDLYGYQVRLLNSVTIEDKDVLSKDTLEEYIDQFVKIYQKPNIQELTFELDDEVEDCLVNALTVEAVNNEGQDISDYFISPSNNTTFYSREVVNFITITLTQYYTGEELSQCEVEVTQPNGKSINTLFDSLEDSNNFDDNVSYREIRLYTEGYVETTDLIGAQYTVLDVDDNPLAILGTPTATLRSVSTTKKIVLPLNRDVTIIPGNYDLRLTYQNEKDVEDAVIITPFKYTGLLPFLSTNIGNITVIEINGLYYLDVEFDENLPVELFEIVGLRVLNEDGEDFSSQFEPITESNEFEDINFIENLEDPYRIRLMLSPGESLNAGNYTIEFFIDVGAGEDDDSEEDEEETEGEDDDEIDEEEDNSDTYTLWSYSITLPYMIHEIQNSIKSIEVAAVNKLKVTLEYPVDVSLIQKYTFSLLDTSANAIGLNPEEYLDTFKSVTDSNFFGMYLLPTDQRYILYSFNGNDWDSFDTQRDFTIKKVFYDMTSKYSFALCGNGKLLRIKDFTRSGTDNVSVIDSGVSKALNDYLLLDDSIFLVGADATIMKASLVEGELKDFVTIKTNATTKTLTCISHIVDNTLICGGYDGALIISTDKGETWRNIDNSFNQNINKVIYYKNVIEITEEPDDPEDDEYGTTIGDEESEPIVVETIDNSCIILVGAKGLLAYSTEVNVPSFTLVDTGTTKSFFDVCGHDDTIIAVGDGGLIAKLSSEENGLEYNIIESGVTHALRGIVYADTKFMVCGSNGHWLTSVSGSVWTTNSYYRDLTFRSISFVPSQYGGTKGDWFYVEIEKGQDLGRTEIHKGTEDVSDVSNLNNWSGDERDQHVFEIYRRYGLVNGVNKLISTHQYMKEITVEGSGEDAVTVTTYSWKPCANMSNIRTGSYYGKIYISYDSYDQLLYTTKTPVDLPYMVDNPGKITEAKLVSPDGIEGPEVVYPFLEITMEDANEFMLFYSSYSIFIDENESYNPASGLFDSIPNAELIYDYDYDISGIRLFVKPKKLPFILAHGSECTLSWDWMVLAKEKSYDEVRFSLQSLEPIIESDRLFDNDPGRIQFNLTTPVPISYFSHADTVLSVYRVSGTDNKNYDNDYSSYFKTIMESTNFSTYTPVDGGYRNFDLMIEDNQILPAGEYIFKLYNKSINFETDDTLKYFTSKRTFHREIVPMSSLPVISSVRSELYAEVTSPLTSHTPEECYGNGDPTVIQEMVNITANWELAGEEVLKEHVGDIYTDEDTLDKWYFIQDSVNKTYRWNKSVNRPYVSISFSPMPIYDVFVGNFSSISLKESDNTDLTKYLNTNIDYWIINTMTVSDVKRITKIYIPIDETQNFSGSSNATITIEFKQCIYKTLTYSQIKLSPYIHSYGGIQNISKINVSLINKKQVAGLYVEFERPQLPEFLKTCTFDVERQYTENGVNTVYDWSGSFMTITESNSEELSKGLPMKAIWLLLHTDSAYMEELHSGTYELTLTGDKPSSDLGSDSDNLDDIEVVMKKKFKTPWLTTNHPKKLTASLDIKDTKKAPILNLTFKGSLPALSSCLKFKLKIERILKNGTQDYSDCFAGASKATYALDDEVFDPEEEKVKKISIRMKNSRCLPKGTYKVTFQFHKQTMLDPIPYSDNSENWAKFTVSSALVTTIGTVKKVTVKKRKMTVEIKPLDTLKTDALLKKSQVGKALKVKNWKALMKKLGLVMAKGSVKNAKSSFKSSPKVAKAKVTYELKANKKLNPGSWSFSFNYKNRRVIKAKKVNFKGIIYNKAGKGGKDKTCWILKETHNGNVKCKIYKSYEAAYKRIKKMKKLNAAEEAQYAKCTKCRKKKFFSTTKIRAQLEKYEFVDKSLIRAFIKKLANKYYKKIVKKTTKCTECKIIKYTPDTGTSDKHIQFHCDNYIAKKQPYTWKFRIGTMATKFPSGNASAKSRKIYFKTITIKNVSLPRGFKATKSGAKSKAFKSYETTMKDWITKYKKKVARCKKCKKYEIAKKGGVIIGWGSALFPDSVRTRLGKDAEQLLKKYLQKFFKKKREKKVTVIKVDKKGERVKKTKKKKYYIGCKNAQFSFVKKNKSYCKIKCAKQKTADSSLKLNEFKGICIPIKMAKVTNILVDREEHFQGELVSSVNNVILEHLIPMDSKKVVELLEPIKIQTLRDFEMIQIPKGK